MLKQLLIPFIVFMSFATSSQTLKLSAYSEVSIITSGPGTHLYEKFGHTAIRVKDPVLNFDLIYNYGIFDLGDANFYVNFTKGFMTYKLARYDFYHVLKNANHEKRWVKQQTLNLTSEEKTLFFEFLQQNATPENASYFYDPFFNNCATKPRDIIKLILKDKLILAKPNTHSKHSLRSLMNEEINTNTWGSLGINVALGNRLDKMVTAEESMYLPDYVYSILEHSKIKRDNQLVPLVKQTKVLLDFKEKEAKSDVINPVLIFALLLFIGIYITYRDFKAKRRTKWFDAFLFFTTGVIGILIIFLWCFTTHSTAPNNFNFLWAFAPNFIVGFYVLKTRVQKWVMYYIRLLLVFLSIIPLVWLSKIQVFNSALLFIFALLALRYWYLQKALNG